MKEMLIIHEINVNNPFVIVTMVLYGAILHIYDVSRSIKYRMVSKWLHVYEIGFEPSVTIKKARYRVGDFISILNRDGHNNNRS